MLEYVSGPAFPRATVRLTYVALGQQNPLLAFGIQDVHTKSSLLCSLVVIILLSLFSVQGVLWQQKTRRGERRWSYHLYWRGDAPGS